MESQKPAQSRVRGLLKDLTSSSEQEARHLLEWLEAFSKRLMKRADEVTAEVHKLVEGTEVVEQELHNTFNSFRGLSTSQFVENHVYEEDETMFIHQEAKVQDQGIPSQSYESDIVPRYKEAVATACNIYEQHICKPYKRSSGPHKSRMLAERWHKQLPHIIGTEDFMRDNSCGLAEDRSSGMETFEFESDTEREAADMTAELTNTGLFLETEQSGSESDVSDVQVGSFEPAVSAALNFKAMLEAALRSSYIPHSDAILSNSNASIEHLTPTTAISTISEEFYGRNISKEDHTTLQSDLKMEQLPMGHTQNSTTLKKHFKAAPSFTFLTSEDAAEVQDSSDPTESQTLFSPKKSGTEKEHVAKGTNNIIKVLPGSATSGGLFDDENEEDEFVSLSKVFGNINSWSSPTIPDGLFNVVQSPSSGNNGARRSSDKAKADKKDLSHSPSNPQMKPSLHPERLSSLKTTSYGHVHDLFSFQSSSSGGVPLRESLSVFRKGLFDDDNDDDDTEDDTKDLFGSSSSVEDAQSFKETVSNDLLEDPKGKASLSREKQKSAASMLLEDSRGDGDEGIFSNPSQAEQVLMNHSIGLQKNLKDEIDSSTSLEASVVVSKEDYSGRNDSLSSPDELRGSYVITSLEQVSNSKNLSLLPSDKESGRPLNTMTNVEKLNDSHHLGTEKNLSAVQESDDGVDSWSSTSSIRDIVPSENMVKNVFQSLQSSMRNGFHDEESQQWSEKDEGIGVCLSDQRTAHELNTDSYSEVNENVIDASVGCHKGKNEETNLDQVEEVPETKCCAPEEEVKNVSSEWSRTKSLLQEHLNLQPFGPALRQGATVSPSKAFVVDARAGKKDDNGLKDMAHLYHATLSRPRGSSRRRGPTSVKRIPLHRSNVDATSVPPGSSTEVEQIVAHSPENQEQTARSSDSDSVRMLVAEDDKWAQMDSLNYLSKQAGAVMQASSASRDANKIEDRILPNMGMAVKKISEIDDRFRYSEGEDILKRMASRPKQDTEEPSMKSRSTTVNAEKASFSSILFGDENNKDEVDLFGALQGGTSTSLSNSATLPRNQGKRQFLFDSDEENSGSESKVSIKGAHLKGLTQQLQGTPGVGSMGTPRKSIGRSLFDEDDDNDPFT